MFFVSLSSGVFVFVDESVRHDRHTVTGWFHRTDVLNVCCFGCQRPGNKKYLLSSVPQEWARCAESERALCPLFVYRLIAYRRLPHSLDVSPVYLTFTTNAFSTCCLPSVVHRTSRQPRVPFASATAMPWWCATPTLSPSKPTDTTSECSCWDRSDHLEH